MTKQQSGKVKWFGPAARKRELGTLTEMQKRDLIKAHNDGMKLGPEVHRIGTDYATAEAFLKRQPGYPGEITPRTRLTLEAARRQDRKNALRRKPEPDEPPAERRKQRPSLPPVRFLDSGNATSKPDYADYNAGLNGQRSYELAMRTIRLNGIRAGQYAPRPDDAEEMEAAREAGLVIDRPAAHRVSA